MTQNNDDKKNSGYTVGYGRPPKDKQFKPGQRANPDGRPKGSKNFDTIFESEIMANIPLTEGKRQKKVSKKKAFIKILINKALAGNPKAMPMLLELIRQHEARKERRANKTLLPPITGDITAEEAERKYREALKNAKSTR